MKDRFNKYCAGVMWLTIGKVHADLRSGQSIDCYYTDKNDYLCSVYNYNPYDDLNQMAEVFDKLWQIKQPKSLQQTQAVNKFRADLANYGIRKAMRNLIISTMEEE